MKLPTMADSKQARDSNGAANRADEFPYLTFPQVRAWIITRDFDALRQIADDDFWAEMVRAKVFKHRKKTSLWGEKISYATLVQQQNAEASLARRLLKGDVTAIGRKNGTGDPEAIPAIQWSLLEFYDRGFGRGFIPCASLKGDPEVFWSDLRFEGEKVFAVWELGAETPAGAPMQSTPQPRRKSSRNVIL